VSSPSSAADVPNTILRPLLQRQLRALRGRYLRHGLGLVLAALAGVVLLFFALDRWLLLPLPIRLLHTAAVLATAGFGFWRFVRYPLSRRFEELDAAVWFERAFPALHQRVVSAVQLAAARDAADPALRNQSQAMIDRLLAETAEAVQALPLQNLFDPRPTRRTGAAALLGGLLLLVGAWSSPAVAKAFLLRHLGLDAEYPRQTSLFVELPPAGPDLQLAASAGRVELTLPAGADLHVGVRVEGTVPKEVFLDVVAGRDGGGEVRSVSMSPRPGERFRHVFRRLAGSFSFRARGGDDPDGDLEVVVRTVHPPQVANLRAVVTPPAYTGVQRVEQPGGAIEALVGSDVELAVTTTTAVKQATLVFLESGKRVDLVADAPSDDSGQQLVQRARFVVEASDRYQVELLAENGLRNPNPGTYPIAALQDYAPVGRWLLPEDEGLQLLRTALLCVRIDARDDFGLAGVDLRIERDGALGQPLPLLAAAPGGPTPVAQPTGAEAPGVQPVGTLPTGTLPTGAVLTHLLELSDLLADAPANDTGLVLQVQLRDNRAPLPGSSELPRRIVQVVEPPQLADAIGRLFRGLREEVAQALEIQQDRRARLEELAGAGRGSLVATQLLTSVEVGQGRIAGSGERIHRGLMRAFDLHLWNRLEPSQHAPAVVELYMAHSRTLQEPVALDPAFYRDLQQRRAAGTLGALERVLDPILAMIAAADQIVLVEAPAIQRTLAEMQVARDDADFQAARQRAQAGQLRCEQLLQALLDRLEEWNDYQDLVQEVRGLRDRQRDLQQRTEEARGKK
jgi:hypothetical protein